MIKRLTCTLFSILLLACSSSDSYEEVDVEIHLPSVSTTTITNITENSASVEASVSDDGGANVTERGFVWSLNANPTTSDNKKSIGLGKGSFSVTLTDLEVNTIYNVRAYAINSKGVSYSNQQQFTTLDVELQQKVFEGDVILKTQSEVDDFGVEAYTEITGSLIIQGSDSPSSIKSINNFSSIIKIGGGLVIERNDELILLSGFESLEFIGGGFSVRFNNKLEEIGEFSSLTHIGDFFKIADNVKLSSLLGFSKLQRIDGRLVLIGIADLENLDIFSNLESIGTLEILSNSSLTNIDALHRVKNIGYLNIDSNESLTNIEGLSSLETINGDLTILNNSNLSNLDGLNFLTFVLNEVYIRHNNSLMNIDGLQSLNQVKGGITITANAQLNDFCGLVTIFETGWSGFCNIQNNLYNPVCSEISEENCSG